MSECTHDCSTCGADCASRKDPKSFLETPNDQSSIKRIVAVASGKGGVGKSFVTASLAVMMSRRGYKCAVLDADVTGPSIARLFGVTQKCESDGTYMFPAQTKAGVDVISVNMLLQDDTTPVVWRGPVIAGVVKQFYTDVIWKDIDFLFVDMPPGTGDVPLTVFQSLPVNAAVLVSTPQDLVSMIVGKAVNMAQMMNIPVAGLIENMAYVECPDCGKQIRLFGESSALEVAAAHHIGMLASMPIKPENAQLCDEGRIDEIDIPALDGACEVLEALIH